MLYAGKILRLPRLVVVVVVVVVLNTDVQMIFGGSSGYLHNTTQIDENEEYFQLRGS